MASLYKGLALSLLLAAMATAPAAVVAEDITVWSAVSFAMYGERTPLVGPTAPALTPLGAQQMYAQGSTLRNRYILDGSGNSSTSTAALLPVHGIEPNALDAAQVAVFSTDYSYVAAGAMAFMQGLYPPQETEYAYDNGGRDAAVLANGALVHFPLDGYQYPFVETYSLQDPTSSWLAGDVECTAYHESAIEFQKDTNALLTYNSTLGFYQNLWPTVFQGVFSEPMTSFFFAYHLYDYASYQYNHDPQVANTLNASELEALRIFASTQQLDLNANLSASGNEEGDMIRAISGRMLAQQVVTLFRQSMLNDGANNKLSLMFGSFEPFLSFFALSGLLNGAYGSDFKTLPDNGAVMLFELYSLTSTDTTSGNDTVYPSPDDLYVRFLYRPDTDADTTPTQYGLFTNTTTELNMTFPAFAEAMEAIGIESVAAWCHTCSGVSSFCPGLLENGPYGSGSGSGTGSGGDSGKSKTSSKALAVAGVIGALVTLCVVALGVLAAMLLGGLRFVFAARRRDSAGQGASVVKRFSFGHAFAGGFKGSERKTADADVAVSRVGVGHERIGSWELRHQQANASAGGGGDGGDGGGGGDGDGAVSPTDVGSGAGDGDTGARTERVRSTILNRQPDEDDDDIMVDLGRGPVNPREHV